VALIKFCDGTVLSTQLACTDDDDGEGWLELTMTRGGIKLNNLRPDFTFQLEIYRLVSPSSLLLSLLHFILTPPFRDPTSAWWSRRSSRRGRGHWEGC
jgi:hypothetical protein